MKNISDRFEMQWISKKAPQKNIYYNEGDYGMKKINDGSI